jgi:hypothetical protein
MRLKGILNLAREKVKSNAKTMIMRSIALAWSALRTCPAGHPTLASRIMVFAIGFALSFATLRIPEL